VFPVRDRSAQEGNGARGSGRRFLVSVPFTKKGEKEVIGESGLRGSKNGESLKEGEEKRWTNHNGISRGSGIQKNFPRLNRKKNSQNISGNGASGQPKGLGASRGRFLSSGRKNSAHKNKGEVRVSVR